MSDPAALADDLVAVGFSRRAANTLVYSVGIASLDELRTAEWGDGGPTGGLYRRMLVTPNCGRRLINRVIAFRESGDPRRPGEVDPAWVTVRLEKNQLADLDRWIAAQPDEPSRSAAVRRLALQALRAST